MLIKFYLIWNKHKDIICIKTNQQYNSSISLFIYDVLFDMLLITIYLDQYYTS